jgi:hypothetical protein
MEYKGSWNATTNVPALSNAAVKASKIIQSLTYAADVAGIEGNDITIEYVADGTAGAETVDVTVNAIVVHMQSGVSTATMIKTAVDNKAEAAALVDVTISGAGGDFQTGPVSATNLAGGISQGNAGDVYKVATPGSHNFGAGAITFVLGDYAICNSSNVWELAHSGADAVISVNGEAGAVVLTTDDISDAAQTNKYYTATAARGDLIAATITDGDTTHAPDGNSVFDALAGKSNTGHGHVAADVSDFTSAAKSAAVSDAIVDGVTDVAPSQNAVFDALALKADAASGFATFTNDNAGAITVGQVVYVKANGKVDLARANAIATAGSSLGIVRDASIAGGGSASGTVWLPGASITGSSMTPGATKFLDVTTAGATSESAPALTVGNVVRELGTIYSATKWIFMPRAAIEVVS